MAMHKLLRMIISLAILLIQKPIRTYMKNRMRLLFVFVLAVVILPTCNAQQEETFKKKGYTLIFKNGDPSFDAKVKERMVKTFFEVYPVLAKEYNSKTITQVVFLIDTAYTGVAEAGGGQVRISSRWMHSHPNDIDVVTHEVMHLVQNYPGGAGPWWVTEGIADYVRQVFGVDNAGGGWALPNYKEGQNYTDSYRITARFLLWIEKQVKPGFVKALDAAMRSNTYKSDIWKQQTGKDIDQLWKEYAQNPVIAKN